MNRQPQELSSLWMQRLLKNRKTKHIATTCLNLEKKISPWKHVNAKLSSSLTLSCKHLEVSYTWGATKRWQEGEIQVSLY